MMACRDCKFLDVPPRADGKVVPVKSKCYPCRVELLRVPLPRSARGWSWRERKPSLSAMSPDEGDNCFFWEKRK